jgi:hypothetical protein
MKNTTDRTKSKQETQYLLAIPGIKEKLIEGSETPIEKCEDVDNINWDEIEKETGNQDNRT